MAGETLPINNDPRFAESRATTPYGRRWLVTIHEGGEGGHTVTGYLPETVSEQVEANWNTLFNWNASDMLRIVSLIQGKGAQFAWQNALVWMGQNPYNIQINLEFYANTNAKADVYDKCQKLLAMASPSKSSGGKYALLTPPGPNLFNQVIEGVEGTVESAIETLAKSSLGLTELKTFVGSPEWTSKKGEIAKTITQGIPKGRPITVNIGRLRSVNNCVIKNVTVNYGVPLDPSGYPLKAEAQISIERATVFTREDAGG